MGSHYPTLFSQLLLPKLPTFKEFSEGHMGSTFLPTDSVLRVAWFVAPWPQNSARGPRLLPTPFLSGWPQDFCFPRGSSCVLVPWYCSLEGNIDSAIVWGRGWRQVGWWVDKTELGMQDRCVGEGVGLGQRSHPLSLFTQRGAALAIFGKSNTHRHCESCCVKFLRTEWEHRAQPCSTQA